MCSARMLAEIASASAWVGVAANCGRVGTSFLVRGAVGSVELQAASTTSARAVGTAVRRCIGNSWLQPRPHGARLVPLPLCHPEERSDEGSASWWREEQERAHGARDTKQDGSAL